MTIAKSHLMKPHASAALFCSLLLAACGSMPNRDSPVAVEDGQPVASKPFLDCAASRASYLYLLKQSGHDKRDEQKEVERDVQFYLQVAESLDGRSLRNEFLKSGENEREKAEKMIKTRGRGAYLADTTDRKKECAALVRKHQKEIMKAADKLYGQQEKR